MRKSSYEYPKLAGMTSWMDHELGLGEEFVQPRFGGGRTIAVVGSPVDIPHPIGWVHCHSFSLQQIYLLPVDVPAVRELSRAGFRTLRFQCQGYGDSELPADNATLESHVAETVEAVEFMRGLGVQEVGLFGSRFGGAVAALAADVTGATGLIMWQPAINGKSFFKSLLRQSAMSRVSIDGSTNPDPIEMLHERGRIELQGFPISRAAYEQIAGLDLAEDLQTFSGRALLIEVASASEPGHESSRLQNRLQVLGADVTHKIVNHPRPQVFGGPRYRPAPGLGVKVDRQGDLIDELVSTTLAWCKRHFQSESQTVDGESA